MSVKHELTSVRPQFPESEVNRLGCVILVIEAMKMKNSIRSVRDGKIATVHVSAGQTVMHKQALVEFSA